MPNQKAASGIAENSSCATKQHGRVIANAKQCRNSKPFSAVDNVENLEFSVNTLYLTQCKDQLKATKVMIKRLNHEVQQLEKTVLQRDGVIKELREKIQTNTLQCPQTIADVKKLQTENAQYAQLCNEQSEKLSTLESTYDAKCHNLRSEFERWSAQQSQEQQNLVEHIKKLTEELKATHDDRKMKEEKLSQCEDELKALKAKIEFEIKNDKQEQEVLIKEYRVKIADLQSELKQKEDIIQQCQLKYNELETSKNKIIREQAYKLKQVNRVMDQPTVIVPPVSSNAMSVSVNEEVESTRIPSASPSPTSQFKRPYQTTRTKNQMHEPSAKQVRQLENTHTVTKVRFRSKDRKVNYAEVNDSSSDDESIAGWPLVLPKENTNKTHSAFLATTRPYEDVVIPASPDSEDKFDRLLEKRNRI